MTNVRDLKPDDRVAWEALFRGYIAFYEATITDAVVETTFARLLSDEPWTHTCFLGVDADDTPIGLAHVLFHRSTWSETGYLYLEDLFVSPAARGQGIGGALIERVYAHADQLGATRTYWATQEFNTTARSLYDRYATLSPFVQYRRA